MHDSILIALRAASLASCLTALGDNAYRMASRNCSLTITVARLPGDREEIMCRYHQWARIKTPVSITGYSALRFTPGGQIIRRTNHRQVPAKYAAIAERILDALPVKPTRTETH